MQVVASQSTVELSWALQSALAAGITVACGGVALTFKRPAMRALAVAFVLITLAAGVIWLALTASSRGASDEATILLISMATPLTPVLTFLVYRQMIALLAGRASSALPSIFVMTTAGLGAFGLTVTLALMSSGAVVVALVATAATLVALGWLAALAHRARGDGVQVRALLLLEVSFLAFGFRSLVNVWVAAVAYASGGKPTFTLATTVMQAFFMVAGAVLQLVAVLDEERTASVQQAEQLRQAELAVASSQRFESLGRMAGIVAHDFNNVLSVISMSAQSAVDQKGVAVDEELREIDASCKRGQALVVQLLAFARQAPQQVSRFDANVQLDKLRGLLHRVAQHANIEVSAAGPPLMVEMDNTQFDQIVMNLVVNARDATPPGGMITVQLAEDAQVARPSKPQRSGATAAATSYARISVSDTGSGIPADVLPHIFEPFFTTKKASDGTGLGLAICDGIVRRLGGRIEVHSEPGKGTRFDVLIPKVTTG